MQNAFLLFTKIMFDNFFVCACAQIKFLDDKPSYHFRLFGFYLFFRFTFFSSSFIFAAVVGLLQGSFGQKNFRESVKETRTTCMERRRDILL